MSRALALSMLLAACGSGPVIIDARGDAGRPGAPDAGAGVDAGPFDGGARMDGGAPMDAGGDPDGGCEDPTLPAWIPVDTGGPDGEGVSACLTRVGSATDDRVPVDQGYDLTTFGGPGDEQPVACGGPDADGTWYYAANRQRFSCGQRVRIVDAARSRCVVVEIADVGPNSCVEEAGERPIWDVSPLAAQHLFGASSVGWSEHRAVYGAPVDGDNPLGACDAHLAGMGAGFVGSGCATAGDCGLVTEAQCLTAADGYPGGHCTRACTTSCPDQDGAYAYTGCADPGDGVTRCFARCDFTLSATGCRPGYACTMRPHPTGSGDPRWVCLPSPCGG